MWAPLVPELGVTDVEVSLPFYRDLLGFEVAYERPQEGFAYLHRDGAELMLDQVGLDRTFLARDAPLVPPFGRGMNLQIAVRALDPILEALADAGIPLHLAPEQAWYRAGKVEHGMRQCVVADPDGYLLRLAEGIGTRRGRQT
ncbi:MAG: bleomycin resistance protein [Paracoccaceae bacterium]